MVMQEHELQIKQTNKTAYAEKARKYFTNKNKKIRRGEKYKEIINNEWIIHD